MKNYTQVYVKNSMEAAKTYCKAFGAEITLEMKDEAGTAYEHCELSVNGEGFMGTEESVRRAFDVLSDGGVVIDAIHELPWSKCCATVIDRYGVCWWISI